MIRLVQRYDLFGFLNLLMDIMVTKIFFPQARIIRRPFYIRGRRFIKIGKRFTAGVGLRLDAFPAGGVSKNCIQIGNDVQVNDYVHIGAIESLKIGNNVLIASKVFISDHNHGVYSGSLPQSNPDVPPLKRELSALAVEIADNVWIGESVGILAGVQIGKGSVIGCGSIVTCSIPQYSLAVGNPARVIKKYNTKTQQWEKT